MIMQQFDVVARRWELCMSEQKEDEDEFAWRRW